METTDTTTADVKAAKYNQTALVAELSRLSAQATAELGVQVVIHASGPTAFFVHAANECTLASTVDEAVSQMARIIETPQRRAAKKRELAHRLIIEAQAISPEVAA